MTIVGASLKSSSIDVKGIMQEILNLRPTKLKRQLSREEKDKIDSLIAKLIKTEGLSFTLKLFPKKLLSFWQQLFSREFKLILKYSFEPLPKIIRVNTLKSDNLEFTRIAKKYSWKVRQVKFFPNTFIILSKHEVNYLDLPEYNQGLFYFQQLSSMLPVIILNPQLDDKVLDIGAAPGSKTTQIAAVMKNKGEVRAVDVDKDRFRILVKNLERLGCRNVKASLKDGRNLGELYHSVFDKVLVDAPCSSEGIIRYKAHKLVEWSERQIKSIIQTQKDLIKSGFLTLKPGGVLVYSTCTYEPEENEGVINDLLNRYSNADVTPIKSLRIKSRPGLIRWKGKRFHKRLKQAIRIYPQDLNSTGFFICKIVKRQ